MTQQTATSRPDLRSRFEELDASYAQAVKHHKTLVVSLAGDVAGDDVADSGMKVAVAGEDEAEIRRLADRRQQMERALERVSAGTYGVCESCSRPIPAERLRFLPETTTCVACQQKAERFARR